MFFVYFVFLYFFLVLFLKKKKNTALLCCQVDQSFATPIYAFWDIDFKWVIKKQKTQKELLTFYLPKGIPIEKPA